MSLPLTRRIAKVVLLAAAGAAPVVGAAGPSHALDLPDAPPNPVGGVDGTALGETVDGVSEHGGSLLRGTGSEAVDDAVPAAGRTVRTIGKAAVPAIVPTPDTSRATETTDAAQGLLDRAVKSDGILPADLPVGDTQLTDMLPIQLPDAEGLPTDPAGVDGVRVAGVPARSLLT